MHERMKKEQVRRDSRVRPVATDSVSACVRAAQMRHNCKGVVLLSLDSSGVHFSLDGRVICHLHGLLHRYRLTIVVAIISSGRV